MNELSSLQYFLMNLSRGHQTRNRAIMTGFFKMQLMMKKLWGLIFLMALLLSFFVGCNNPNDEFYSNGIVNSNESSNLTRTLVRTHHVDDDIAKDVLLDLAENFPQLNFEIVENHDWQTGENAVWVRNLETERYYHIRSGQHNLSPSTQFVRKFYSITVGIWNGMFRESLSSHLFNIYHESVYESISAHFIFGFGVSDLLRIEVEDFARIETKRNTISDFDMLIEEFPNFKNPNDFIMFIRYTVFVEDFDLEVESYNIISLFQEFALPIQGATTGDFRVSIRVDFVNEDLNIEKIFEYSSGGDDLPLTVSSLNDYFETLEEHEQRMLEEFEQDNLGK